MKLRLMTMADVSAGMRLKDLAGWNQTPADWERFLSASPDGCFVAETEGRVVGTVTTIVYQGRFAWIGMVLVDPEFRGQRIGTRLLNRAIEHLDSRGVATLKLDATPQGKPIYEKLGFVSEYEVERWTLQCPAGGAGSPTPPHPRPLSPRERGEKIFTIALSPGERGEKIFRTALSPEEKAGISDSCPLPWGEGGPRPALSPAGAGRVRRQAGQSLGAPEMEEVLELDREVFGADRSELLRSLVSAAPDLTLAIREGGALVGYAFGRRGSVADHLGPWIAKTESAAGELLEEFQRRSSREKLFVDGLQSHPWAKALLRACGFEFFRPLTRMYRGPNHYPGRPEWLCAVLGPEFG